jgi:hypothetical protein
MFMRLLRQKALLLVLFSTIACSDSTGPRTISAFFTLQSIDGRALPTYIATTPGPTTTIISSSLLLDKTGKAVRIEHRNEMFRGDVTDTTTYQYTMHGAQIEIFVPEVCLAIYSCPPVEWTGTISPFALSLVVNPYSTDSHIVYHYRTIGLD